MEGSPLQTRPGGGNGYGARLLAAAGWRPGQGLGAGQDGIVTPVRPWRNRGRQGVGAAGNDGAPKPKPKPPDPPEKEKEKPAAAEARAAKKQRLVAEREREAERAIARYLSASLSGAGSAGTDTNPLLRGGANRLTKTNPLLDDDDPFL